MARGKHLFPFRTEQLSPSAPMVLGPQGPGRVGRRRLYIGTGRPLGGPFCVVGHTAGERAAPGAAGARNGLCALARRGEAARLAPVQTARLELRRIAEEDL